MLKKKNSKVFPKKRNIPNKPKTIGVVGTRRRDSGKDLFIVQEEFLKHYVKGDRICSGLCPKGADRFAVDMAHILGIPRKKILWFPADWPKYGKIAGFMRNTDIARESDILIACVAKDRKGGTEDTISKFVKFHGDENLIIV